MTLTARLKKYWLNGVLIAFILLMLFYPPAKVWVLQRVMDTGIFNKSGIEHPTYRAQPMAFINAENRIINTEQLKGKMVFLNFWATWCPPCLAELPSIARLKERYRNDSNVVFIMADVDNNLAFSTSFLRKRLIDLPVYALSGKPDPALYKGTLPTTIILDRDGKVLLNHAGIGRYDTESIYRLIDEQRKR